MQQLLAFLQHGVTSRPRVSWLFNAYGAYWPAPMGLAMCCGRGERGCGRGPVAAESAAHRAGSETGESGQRYAVHDRSGRLALDDAERLMDWAM